MPHIRLTLSRNIAARASLHTLLPELVSLLCSFETVDPATVKAYAFVPDTHAMGEGAPRGFIHCEVSVLTGRPEDLRARMADAFRDRLDAKFRAQIDAGEAGVTIEVREMDKATYRKSARD